MDPKPNNKLSIPTSRKTKAKLERQKTAKKQALSEYTDEDLALILNIWRQEIGLKPC